jgi:Uma2 family endonuclease
MQDAIDRPLSKEALTERFRALCDDKRFADLPGKIEIDAWGRLIVSPASNRHGLIQARVSKRLAVLGGESLVEAAVLTRAGVLVADVAWVSPAFLEAHATESPYTQAPELCIEVVSPSNSTRELSDKVAAYLGAGAVEVWLLHPHDKRVEHFGNAGLRGDTAFQVDLTGVMD